MTSRPLDSAEQELLAGADQALISLELNSKHIAKAVRTYVVCKVAELDHRQRYDQHLRYNLENELTSRAEDTYLWVSLVCKRLEAIYPEEALKTIQDLPPGLNAFYSRVFDQLHQGDKTIGRRCMRLLKVMTLAYRPLSLLEIESVTGFPDQQVAIDRLVDRCASFLRVRGTYVDFVHQSARDYLSGNNKHLPPDFYDKYGHSDITLNCVAYLLDRLKVNLLDLPRPDSTRESVKKLKDEGKTMKLASLGYAATFWTQHLKLAEDTLSIQNAFFRPGKISQLLHIKFLEWLECLSLLDQLSGAIEAFQVLSKILSSVADVSKGCV